MTVDDRPRMGRFAPQWRQFLYRQLAHRYFRRSLSTADGVCDVYVTGGAQLSVLNPTGVPVDPVHTNFIARWVKPDSVVWDIGGNMGLFAFPAAMKARAGQVYTFEPDNELACHLLYATRRPRNARLPVKLMPFALSDSDGLATFQIAAHGTSMNKLAGVGEWHNDLFVVAEERTVVTQRIDTIASALKAPDIMKIDVEGAEMRVLDGGRKTISDARPVVLIEGPKELAVQIAEYFRSLDYVFEDGALNDRKLIDEVVWDTIAVPREKWHG